MTDIEQFMNQDAPEHNDALAALWWEAKGDWNRAHQLVQDSSPNRDWVHAYLHRVEGDLPNAAYWYRRASKPVCESDLKEEWSDLVRTLSGQPVD